ncbi:hypothetical protein, partial [Escherichia coli]|uniref:hypothetical protein n=1 Tax=Escherichia coli TaxID=562 RepID=UPI002452E6D9
SIICSPMTSLKTSIKTITYLSDTGCLEIQGASLAMVFPYPSSDYVEEIISLDKCIITRLEEVIHDDLGKPAAKVSLTMNFL